MISVVFYGRNDSHGYNLHRRAALSINCIAEVLDDPDDEILFCDWNTTQGLPTFPEAIADTLTERARELIRIIKVPSWVHDQRYSHRTHMPTVESAARNVSVARSNPNNRWILSTNTDMLFLTSTGESLSQIAAKLDDGFYELPRYSLPEAIWEGLPRAEPKVVMETVGRLAREIDLDEVVMSEPFMLYDAPGDFQLMLRDQVFEIGGFDEEMLIGWHVDSNICRRLNLLNGSTQSLADAIAGYHCEHTRILTAHHTNPKANDLARFVYHVEDPSSQATARPWGLTDLELEEVTLGPGIEPRYLTAMLKHAPAPEQARPPVNARHGQALAWYSATHALPFLLDPLAIEPTSTEIAYVGSNPELLVPMSRAIQDMGFPPLRVWDGFDNDLATVSHAVAISTEEILEKINFVIIDLGLPLNRRKHTRTAEWSAWDFDERRCIGRGLEFLEDLANRDRRIKTAGPSRRVAVTNAVYSRLDAFTTAFIVTPSALFNSRIRVGLIRDEPMELPDLILTDLKFRVGYRATEAEISNLLPADKEIDYREPALIRSLHEGEWSHTPYGMILRDRAGTIRLQLPPDLSTEQVIAFELNDWFDPKAAPLECWVSVNDGERTQVSLDSTIKTSFVQVPLTDEIIESQQIDIHFSSPNAVVPRDEVSDGDIEIYAVRLGIIGIVRPWNPAQRELEVASLRATPYLAGGWSWGDEPARWMDGRVAVVQVPPTGIERGVIAFTLADWSPFKSQQIKIVRDGEVLGSTWLQPKNQRPGVLTVPCPPDGGTFEIVLNETWSVTHTPWPDLRQLGVKVESVEVTASAGPVPFLKDGGPPLPMLGHPANVATLRKVLRKVKAKATQTVESLRK